MQFGYCLPFHIASTTATNAISDDDEPAMVKVLPLGREERTRAGPSKSWARAENYDFSGDGGTLIPIAVSGEQSKPGTVEKPPGEYAPNERFAHISSSKEGCVYQDLGPNCG